MKIVPVIHCLSAEQVMYNADVCYSNGIDFVFLIDHNLHSDIDIKEYFYMIKDKYPGMAVGINYLQLDTFDALSEANILKSECLKYSYKLDAVWADKSYITKNSYIGGGSDLDMAEKILSNNKGYLYFGSVAFKYQKQPHPDELEWVCKTACEYMDVITTSGPSTGKAADIEKIKLMKSYIGNHPLSIASGLSYLNKSQFDPYVDYGLVASSITERTTEKIIESELKKLIK